MFFENIWESQLIQSIVNKEHTLKNKIVITGNNTHDELLESVDPYELPCLYGGNCQCQATCVYSEKGPWTEVENQIDYRNPQPMSDEDVSENEDLSNQFFNMKLNQGGGEEKCKSHHVM